MIDYTQDDFTKGGETYDVIFDTVGKQSFRRSRGSLKPGGVYIATDGLHNLPAALGTRWVGGKKLRMLIARYRKQDLHFLKEVVEAGKYRPVIDRRYLLEEVIDATRYVETGRKTGNVVLTVSHESAIAAA